MIDLKPNQIIKAFVKKTEQDGSISLDRYGTFENQEGLIAWLERFTLDLNDFKRTGEPNRLSSIKKEKDGDFQYDLYIKVYDEADGDDYLKGFSEW